MTEPIFYIEDLNPTDLELLTQLLSVTSTYAISPSWLHDQTYLLSIFPPSLLRSRSLLFRLATTLPFAPAKAQLCPTHKPLNSILIRRIFLELSAECTTHLERLTKNPHLEAKLGEFVKRVHAVSGLWMSPELYRAVFLPVPEDERFEKIESGCEACILASVGGNHRVLSDLRASMLGRRKRGKPHALLLEIVEAWIDWTGRDEIRSESDALAKEVRRRRRQMQKAGRQAMMCGGDGRLDFDHGHGHGQETESETLVDECNDDQPMKARERGERGKSLIAYYAKQMSIASSVPTANRINGLHETFRDSIVFDLESGTFQRIDQGIQNLKIPKTYTASAYSTDSEFGQKQPGHGPSSEKYAQSYQNLLEILRRAKTPEVERHAARSNTKVE
jgi:hypothetical protein